MQGSSYFLRLALHDLNNRRKFTMNKSKDEFHLRVGRQLVKVSREVYTAYYQLRNHAIYVERKDKGKGKVLFSDLDTTATVGEALLPALGAVNVEDLAIANIRKAELRQSLAMLPKKDQALIEALFYDGLSEREYAEVLGISQSAVNKRKHRILRKMKKLLR